MFPVAGATTAAAAAAARTGWFHWRQRRHNRDVKERPPDRPACPFPSRVAIFGHERYPLQGLKGSCSLTEQQGQQGAECTHRTAGTATVVAAAAGDLDSSTHTRQWFARRRVAVVTFCAPGYATATSGSCAASTQVHATGGRSISLPKRSWVGQPQHEPCSTGQQWYGGWRANESPCLGDSGVRSAGCAAGSGHKPYQVAPQMRKQW